MRSLKTPLKPTETVSTQPRDMRTRFPGSREKLQVIRIRQIDGSGKAVTVNGPVTVVFAANPKSDSSFQTVNGDVTVNLKVGLDADLRFRTMTGEAYTDFDLTHIPGTTATAVRRGGTTVFRRNGFSAYRVGKGGPEIRFETLNGNIRVIRQAN